MNSDRRLSDIHLGEHPLYRERVHILENEQGLYCYLPDKLINEIGTTIYLGIGMSINGKSSLSVFTEAKWNGISKQMKILSDQMSNRTSGMSSLRCILANVAKCDLSDGKLFIPELLADFAHLSTKNDAEILIDEYGIYLMPAFRSGESFPKSW